MTITRKLFGATGQTAPVQAREAADHTASYAQKIAQSYEAQRRRRSATIVQLFQDAPRVYQMAA